MDLSVLYCRDAQWLRDAFSLTPEYLRTQEHPRALNLNEYGVPLGRRFRSLKLWFTMRANGRVQLADRIHEQIENAKKLASLIEAHPEFELCAPVHFSLVVFRHKAGDAMNTILLDRANESGKMLLSPNVLNGQKVIRLAIGNYQTTWEDVELVWNLLLESAQEALRASRSVDS
jgi:aromatic-L-amino-acid/L-tryptophan decarboxylase